MKKLGRLYLPLAIATVSPVAFAFSCGAKKQEKVKAVFSSQNILFTNNSKLNAAYDQLKKVQETFVPTASATNYTFENDYLKVVFAKNVVDNILKGQDNALKLIQKAVASMNITTETFLNHDHKNTINIVAGSSGGNSGGYSFGNIEIGIEDKIFNWNFDAGIEYYAQVINHEWGHFETVMPISSKYGTNVFTDNLDKAWNDFIVSSNDDVLKTKTLDVLYDESKAFNHTWKLDNPPFSNPEQWIDINSVQKSFWKTDVVDKISSAPDMSLGDTNAKAFLAELITRLQLCYTYAPNTNLWLNKDVLESNASLMRNLFANQIEALKILNYNLYDGANNAQALNIMTSVFENIYGVGKSSGAKLSFSNDNTIAAISFDSLGMSYENNIAFLAIKDKDNKDLITPIEIQHKDVPLGFYRNIFGADKEYKTIVKSSYVYADNLKISVPDVAGTRVVLEDKDGNPISDVKLSTTFAQDLNKNFDFVKNSW